MLVQKYGGHTYRCAYNKQHHNPNGLAEGLALERAVNRCPGAYYVQRGANVGVGIELIKGIYPIDKDIIPAYACNFASKVLFGGEQEVDNQGRGVGYHKKLHHPEQEPSVHHLMHEEPTSQNKLW